MEAWPPKAPAWKGCTEDSASGVPSPLSCRTQRNPPRPALPGLTSSFVVWLELMRYVWKPRSPTMDQTEKKHTTASSTVPGVKDANWEGGKLWGPGAAMA